MVKFTWYSVVTEDGKILDTFKTRQEARDYRKRQTEKTNLFKVENTQGYEYTKVR